MSFNGQFLHYITQADWIVKTILLLLTTASVFSWATICNRVIVIVLAKRQHYKLARCFKGANDKSEMLRQLAKRKQPVGIEKWLQASLDRVSLTLEPSYYLEQWRLQLEQGVDRLATIAVVAPYVGLLGTVWGILNTFTTLGQVQQATLSMVAPGLSEALIATAFGLFVAIPANVAYNRFISQIDSLLTQSELLVQQLRIHYDT